MEVISLQTILQTPLHKLLSGLSDDHWLQRCPDFPASKFLVFDPRHHQRLRLRVPSEHPLYYRLCASLYQDILLVHKTVKLVPGVWPHILQPPLSLGLDWHSFDFFGSLGLPEEWKQYHPITYRQQQQTLATSEHRFSTFMVKTLWSSPAHPAARTVLYRAQYYSNYPLTAEIIYGTVRYLHLPEFIKDRDKYIAVISITFWQLWNLYWLHGSQNPSPL